MRHRLRLLGITLLVVMSLTALAIQDAIVLKRSDKVGTIIKYQMRTDFDFKGQAVSFTGLITEKVSKIADNGDYTIESTASQQKAIVAGTEQAAPDRTDSLVMKSNGEILTIISEGVTDESLLYRTSNLDIPRFPDTPIKIGDTWTYDIKKNDRGAVDAKGSFKLDGQEKIGDIDTYRLIGSITESTTVADAASMEGTIWVSIKEGTTVKSITNWKKAPTSVGPLDMKVTMTREPAKPS